MKTHVQTLIWINKEVDKINKESVWIGEELMSASDPAVIKILDNKLAEFENKMLYLQSKLMIEKRIATNE